MLAEWEDGFQFSGIEVATCPLHVVERAGDKRGLSELSDPLLLPTPPTWTADRDTLPAVVREIGYPVVVKPLKARVRSRDGSVRTLHVRRLKNAADLATMVSQVADETWVVQPFLVGELYAVCGLAWEGEVVCTIHQVAQRITPALCGGSAFAATVETDRALDQNVAQLVSDAGWSGIFQVQVLRGDDGDFLIDINPRIYGTLGLAVAAGVNLPAMWVDLLLGREPRPSERRAGVHFYRSEEKDGIAIIRALKSGRLDVAASAMLPRRNTVHAAFSLRDPLPLITSLSKLRRITTRPQRKPVTEHAGVSS